MRRGGLLAIVAVVAIATPACSSVTTRTDGDCEAQSPGCGSAQGTAENLAGFTWSAAPVPPLAPRIAQASVWTGTEFLIWGGMDPRLRVVGDGAAYAPVTHTWTSMPASPLSPRDGAFAVWTGTKALFWGGGDANGALLMNGASYDPADRTWALLPTAPLRPDLGRRQAVVWTGTQMVVIQPSAGAAFDPATNSWTPVPALPQVASCQPFAIAAEWTGSEVVTWVAGRPPTVNGITPSGFCNSAYSWEPGNQGWAVVPTRPHYANFPFGTAAPIGGRLLFLGGSSCPPGVTCPAQNFFDGAWFDASSGTWTGLPVTFSGGAGPAVWTGSAMVVFNATAGATPGPSYGPSDVLPGAAAAFDPSGGTWTDLARCPIPDLTNASLAWTGRQLIVVTMDEESGDTPQVEVLSSAVRDRK